MPPEALALNLRSLKLFGMAQAVEELANQGSPAYQAAVAILDMLIKAEVSEKCARSTTKSRARDSLHLRIFRALILLRVSSQKH